MQFSQKTILELFDSSQKSFHIPVYQRAYSWDATQWQPLIDDLLEQIAGKNNYYFGNLLLETRKKGVEYEVIDGQQRLTTLVIFMRSLMTVLKNRKNKEIDFAAKERLYFRDGGNIKLRPVDYDQACFDTLIVYGKKDYATQTPSQKRIYEAREFFVGEFGDMETDELIKILAKIEETELTCIELPGKKDSALMFELQNNRGKDLTNMEKVKSYFMYQMYVNSVPKETEANINHVSNVFKSIYLIVNDLKTLPEDSVLIYHTQSAIKKGFNYRTLEDIKEELKRADDKVHWINEFIKDLHSSFSRIKALETSTNSHWLNIRQLSAPVYVYPFILKGLRFVKPESADFDRLLHAMEILVFRQRLINSRADLISRLNEVLVNFDGDMSRMVERLTDRIQDYWGEYEMASSLNGRMYGNNVLRYVLWRYESKLQNVGYGIANFTIENEQIEHISPQQPSSGQIESGYEVNDQNQYPEDYWMFLNNIGNLLLISGSHNASIGNRPFAEKLKSYNKNPLLNQQVQIKDFVKKRPPKWDRNAIERRRVAIVDNFALSEWSFDTV